MPIQIPDEMEETSNPVAEAPAPGAAGYDKTYSGKFGAAKGPSAVQCIVNPGKGGRADAVTIVSSEGETKVRPPPPQTQLANGPQRAWQGRLLTTDAVSRSQATIPYLELHTFHVITGEGNRKPGISFEHKPDPAKAGRDYRVWMDGAQAKACAEQVMSILHAIERQLQFEQMGDGDDEMET